MPQPLILLPNNLSAVTVTGPDPTTGLCADGSQPQSQALNGTPAGVTTAEQQPICSDAG